MLRHKVCIIILIFLGLNSYAQKSSPIDRTDGSDAPSISVDKIGGCDSATISFTLENALPLTGNNSVVWDFGDGQTESNTLNPVHRYTEPAAYKVSCVFNVVHEVELADPIIITETPYADFKYRDETVDGDLEFYFYPVYFKPIEETSLSYEWTFHEGSVLSDSTCTFLYTEEGSFDVKMKVEDLFGCADSVVKTVHILHNLHVPNVFSPNGDGINDYFKVLNPGDFRFYFKVFTREGLLIYESHSTKIEWDGRVVSGREAPAGVYYYIIESEETPEPTELSGFMHLYK